MGIHFRIGRRGSRAMTAGRYAADTEVSVDCTQAELKALLRRHGASAIALAESSARARLVFELADRRLRFDLPMPPAADYRRVRSGSSSWRVRSDDELVRALAKEERRRWRALLLIIRAKLEMVESGIVSFEQEFLSHIVLPDGRTVAEHTGPGIASAYRGGSMPPLLPHFGGGT